MSGFDLAVSALLTLLLHSTLLFGAVWLAEKARLLRHPGWAELAWRAALFGALLSTALQTAGWVLSRPAAPVAVGATVDGAAAAAVALADAEAEAEAIPARTAETRREIAPASSSSAIDADHAANAGDAAGPRNPVGFSRPLRLPLPDLVAAALLLGWLIGVAGAGLRLARQAGALRRLTRAVAAQGEPAAPVLQAEAERLAAGMALPAPTLRIVAGLASPMLLPDATLLLPAWTPALSGEQRRALLAHEFAHLQRHDPAWRLLTRIAALPLAAHPLARHALARLDALAEDACDARAATLLGDGRPLAECLATCLAHADAHVGTPALAVAMAGEPGAVVRRVTNLLKESTMSVRPLSPALRRGALVLAVIAALALPGIAITTIASDAIASAIEDGALSDGGFSIFGDNQTYRETTAEGRLEIQIRGKVAFNDDESDVETLGAGSSLVIEREQDGVTHWLRVRNVDGRITREFEVDGDPQPWSGAGRAWLAQELPDLLRRTGIDAENRGKRFLARGGVPALLAEIEKIPHDYATRVYLEVLFENAKLADAQLQQALANVERIDSDFERRVALQSALAEQAFAPARHVQLLDLATKIDSDFELAELLSSLAEDQPMDPTVLVAWRAALATMGSDFEQGRVIERLLDRVDGNPALVTVALDSADGISSDFELRQVLERAAPRLGGDEAALAAWFRAAESLGSDFEHRVALVALLEAETVDVRVADNVLASLANIGSDFETKVVLAALAERMPEDAALIERYRAAARGLSDFERGQAEKALDRFAAN